MRDIDIIGILYVLAITGIVIFTFGFFAFGIYADIVTSEGNVTIQEKIGAHGDSGQYLITGKDDQVFTVADNWIYLKFDASDRYASLKVNKTYHVKFTGFRNHLLSWYKNIIEYKEI